MQINRQTKFIAALAIQLLVIFSIVFFKLIVLGNGTEITLHVQPVDPRDFLRGDYVTFRYDISNIESYNFGYSPVNKGDEVYVPLEKSGTYWYVTGLVTNKKPTNSDKIFIKGTVAEVNNKGGFVPVPMEGSSPFGGPLEDSRMIARPYFSARLIYGIEDYFIPEGTGSALNFTGHEVAAKVAVDDNGNSVLKQVYIDGKELPNSTHFGK